MPKKSLPLHTDDFIDHLHKVGLVPEKGFVRSVTVRAYGGELVTMEIEMYPTDQLSETLK